MRKENGSITIFSLIALLLVTAAIFALLEGTRLQEMRRFADLQTKAALESVFANYNTCLWQDYHLLGANHLQMEEILEECANGKSGEGTNLLRLNAEEIEVEGYTRFTDGEGEVFIRNVAAYMKENFVYEAAKEIYSQYKAIKHLIDSSQMDVSDIDTALKEIEAMDVQDTGDSFGTAGEKAEEGNVDVVSILETAKRWKEIGILELVIEDTDQLSTAVQDFSNGLLERELEKGKSQEQEPVSWSDRVFLQQYLLTYMSNFQEIQENRALSYELEYLLGEKSSDIENLKAAVTKLLAVREAANFLYLLSNPTKVAQAEAMVLFIVGTTLNPIIMEMVKIGLLTAWALAESILDVRALLAGKRITLLKSEESWTIGLENLGELSTGFCIAKECSWGLTYEDYLGILLLFEDEKTIAMRTMNAQEATIRKIYQDSFFQIDTLITQANVNILYSYKPVFPFLRVIDAEERWEYTISTTENDGYY